MSKLEFCTIKDLKKLLDQKEISHEELLDFCIERFKKFDDKLGSSLEIFDKKSLSIKKTGVLAGIPGILKDVISQKDRITSCSSKILENYRSNYDATVSARLKDEGAISIGRANCDEFAMGVSNEFSAYKLAKNPWDLSRVSGGSSGGSAVAVAAGLVPWALGTDTGGSVRLPAAFCGLVGIKPTYGLVSRYGLVAYGSSIDQAGVFTKTVYDNALVFSVIAGHDKNDSTSLPVKKADYTQGLDGKLPKNFTIGVLENLINAEGVDEEIKKSLHEAIKVYEKLGAKIVPINLPSLDYGMATYFILSRAEAASNLSRFDGVLYGKRCKNAKTLDEMYAKTRHDGFGLEVKKRIMIGNYVLSAGYADEFYNNAKKVKTIIRSEFIQAFKTVDLLFCPISPITAFKFGKFDNNKLQMDLLDYFACPVNLSGIPALSVPCGFSKENLPIGFQLIGPDLSEDLLYKVAYAYEQQNSWHKVFPQNF